MSQRMLAEYARAVELHDCGHGLPQIAEALDVPYGTIKGWLHSAESTPDTRPPRVPNAPLRDAFLKSGLTAAEVCRRLGWVRQKARRGRMWTGADSTLLTRTLGLRHWTDKREGNAQYWQSTVALPRAQLIADALGVDFDDLYGDVTTSVESAGTCEECGLDLLWRARLCGFCLSPVDRAERADRRAAA